MMIFPKPERQADIHFHFARKLPYLVRMRLAAILIFSGLLIQFLFNFWFGFVFLVFATGISLVKGYSNKPLADGKEFWNQVTPDEYQKVKSKQKELAKWDIDAFDISNPLGGLIFASGAILCFLVYGYFFVNNLNNFAAYWAWDALILFLPHWITGVRTYLKRDRLIIKINLLEKIMELLSAPSDIQVLPMLCTKEIQKTGECVPIDARLMIKLLNAPEYFMGMQVQISINSVQGTDYPYLYCVLIAKEGSGLFKKEHPFIAIPARNITLEPQKSADVEILVVRQTTTTTSGYHTNVKAASHVVDSTLTIARKLLQL